VVLGGFIVIAILLNIVLRCSDPKEQKWLRGEEFKEAVVELPETYKRYRRAMGDEDSEGQAVVDSETQTENEEQQDSIYPMKNSPVKTAKSSDVIVDVKTAFDSPKKKQEGGSPKNQEGRSPKNKRGPPPKNKRGPPLKNKRGPPLKNKFRRRARHVKRPRKPK